MQKIRECDTHANSTEENGKGCPYFSVIYLRRVGKSTDFNSCLINHIQIGATFL